MPWEVTGPVRERERLIETYLTGLYTITELAERFGVSRQKLHKWLARHNLDGMKGLVDRSRAPLHIPHRTNEQVLQTILDFRRRLPHMGPRKIVARLAELHPGLDWPRSVPSEPNDLMTVDYKGHFFLGGDGPFLLYFTSLGTLRLPTLNRNTAPRTNQ